MLRPYKMRLGTGPGHASPCNIKYLPLLVGPFSLGERDWGEGHISQKHGA